MGNGTGLKSPLETLFNQGKYSELLVKFYDSEGVKVPTRERPMVLGALVFSGRGADAPVFFEGIRPELSEEGLAECEFYLVILQVRSGDAEGAKNRLLMPLKSTAARTAFFRHQARAFFNYYLGNKREAKQAAQMALEAAVESRTILGRIFALDLLSHLSFQDGQIQQSLKNFAACAELAKNLGNENFAEALSLSEVLCRAAVTVPSRDKLETLETRLRETRVEDTYSRANILLELARQATLVGEWARAESHLKQALTFIYQFANVKQEVVLNFRWAYLAFCQGDFERALNLISVSKSKAHLVREEPLTLSIHGLEIDILEKLAFGEAFLASRAEAMSRLEVDQSSHVNSRIRARKGLASIPRRRGEDPFADWLDELGPATDPLDRIIESGAHGLLRTRGFVARTGSSVVVDPVTRRVIFSDAISIEVIEFGSRKRLFELFAALIGGFHERSRLFERIWRTRYVPHLHDSVIYANMTNLRKLLGRFANFLTTGEKGYAIASEVQTSLVNSGAASGDLPGSASPPTAGASSAPSRSERAALVITRQSDYNDRQARLLGSMKDSDLIDTRTYAQLFGISTATANRDLRELHSAGKLKQRGRSRDIAYALAT